MARITGKAKWSDDRDGGSEYGGQPGIIQKESTGHHMGDVDSVGEAAMVMRSEGRRLAGVMPELEGTDDLHADAVNEAMADVRTRMNGRRAEDVTSERLA
jgi:hypothetical protein